MTIRLTLTVLSLMRGVQLPPVLDTGSITNPPTTEWSEGEWSQYLRGFWDSVGSRCPGAGTQVVWSKYHLTTKRGPGGGQALRESLHNLWSLPADLLGAIKTLGGKDLSDRLDWLLANRPAVEEVLGEVISPGVFRRIQAIPDAEGKSRVVAILDYLSQTALYPLHSYIFRLLEQIPQDCTFNQGSFLDKVGSWDHGTWYSVDLSKATDRFPIRLISLVLGGKFSPEYVQAWERVMVGYPFQTPSGPVSYAVGNPMGAYSS